MTRPRLIAPEQGNANAQYNLGIMYYDGKGVPQDYPEAAISSGSGLFISQDGYLLTNYHVLEDASKIVVQTKQATFPARVVKFDAANDLALPKITGAFQRQCMRFRTSVPFS